MKLIFIIALLLLVFLVFMKPEMRKPSAHWSKHYDRVVPNTYPVFLDAQTPYLNEQIMFSEWPQEPTSSI